MKFKYCWLLIICYWLLTVYCNGDFYTHGRVDKKRIALTFDDGPRSPYTEEILDILKKYNIKATFFMLGIMVDKYPDAAIKIKNEGHEIGNHTYSHINLYKYKGETGKDKIKKEVERGANSIFKATGIRPKLMRMPYGYSKPWIQKYIKDSGYDLINWTFGCDWENLSTEEYKKRYIEHIKNGAILLLHDGGGYANKMIQILQDIIAESKKRGYEVVTVSELLELREIK